MSGIELIFDKPVDDGAFADCLVAYEDYFEFYCMLFVGCIAEIFIEFGTHSFFKLIICKMSDIIITSPHLILKGIVSSDSHIIAIFRNFYSSNQNGACRHLQIRVHCR